MNYALAPIGLLLLLLLIPIKSLLSLSLSLFLVGWRSFTHTPTTNAGFTPKQRPPLRKTHAHTDTCRRLEGGDSPPPKGHHVIHFQFWTCAQRRLRWKMELSRWHCRLHWGRWMWHYVVTDSNCIPQMYVHKHTYICMFVCISHVGILDNIALHFGTCAKCAISLAAPLFAYLCYLCKKAVTL